VFKPASGATLVIQGTTSFAGSTSPFRAVKVSRRRRRRGPGPRRATATPARARRASRSRTVRRPR
jgi:hypothetical protein